MCSCALLKRRPIISDWDDDGRGRRGCYLCSGEICSDRELAIFPLSPFFPILDKAIMKKEEAMDVESSVPGAGSPFVNRIMVCFLLFALDSFNFNRKAS